MKEQKETTEAVNTAANGGQSETNPFQVKATGGSEKGRIIDALGISDERADEIGDFVTTVFKDFDGAGDLFEKATAISRNANETAWIIFSLEQARQAAERRDPLLAMMRQAMGE